MKTGILKRATDAKELTGVAQIQEELQLAINGLLVDYTTKDRSSGTFRDYIFNPEKGQAKLNSELGASNFSFDTTNHQITYKDVTFDVAKDGTVTKGGETASSGGETPTEPEEPEVTGPTVTVGGTQVTLTPENVADYMGKIVTNYKTPNSTETVTVGENSYTVSTTYRLYYVDFENKYGDGEGTIYLKADCTGNRYELQIDGSSSSSKIQNLNPAIYNTSGYSAPSSSTTYMKEVTWLLDTSKWNGLVTSGANTSIANQINYIVGAPSLEMLIDSYNTRYGLMNTIPDYSLDRNENSSRTKLLYTCPSATMLEEVQADITDGVDEGGYMVSPTGWNEDYSSDRMEHRHIIF